MILLHKVPTANKVSSPKEWHFMLSNVRLCVNFFMSQQCKIQGKTNFVEHDLNWSIVLSSVD